jgi:class 3 adenylate cyclase
VKLYLKITLASFAVAAAVLVFVGVVEYRVQKHALEERFGARLLAIAGTAAPWIDPNGDEEHLKAALERVRAANDLHDYDLFTLKPRTDGSFEFTGSLREWSGDRGYVPPMMIKPLMDSVRMRGMMGVTPFYTDKFATFVSAFAPLRGKDGKVAGLLEVDQDVGVFVDELHRTMLKQMWVFPAALLLAALLAYPIARSMTGALGRLLDGVLAVRGGDFDRPVSVRTRDEIRVLADAFNDMLVALRERFAMLKFVPRHTRAVITEAAREQSVEEGAFEARTRDLAVLFSDIRGFTDFCDSLAPAKVIEMLNIYLKAEAEIVERHGGSIDKFIGDAVMAVFEGPDRFARAADAALEIQSAIGALNARAAFERPIEVGIGIAGGPVVLGAVGYEHRMEFAVIGRLVNLASRLCSTAARGEVVLSEAAYAALGGKRPAERRDGVKLKGFADAVTSYKLG